MDEFRKQIESIIRHDLGIDEIGSQFDRTLVAYSTHSSQNHRPYIIVSIEIGFIH